MERLGANVGWRGGRGTGLVSESLLRTGSIYRLPLPRHAKLNIRSGLLWLTAEGDSHDYLLREGQCYESGRGEGRQVLVEALEDTKVQMKVEVSLSEKAAVSKLGLGLAFAAVYLIWGSTYLAIRFAVESLPPFGMAGARFLLAGLLLSLVLVLCGVPRPSLRQVLEASGIGVLLLLVGNGGVVWAETRGLPSGIAAMIVATTPLWMMLLDRAFGSKQKLRALSLLAGLAGLVGVAFLVYPAKETLLPPVPFWPTMVVLLSAFSWSLGSVLAHRAAMPASPWWTTSFQMLGGGLALMILALANGEADNFNPAEVSARSWLAWLYLVAFGSIVAFSAYLWILRHSKPAQVSTYAFVNPAVALFLGWSLGGEEINARIGFAAALILPSVLVLIAPTKAKDRKEKDLLPPVAVAD